MGSELAKRGENYAAVQAELNGRAGFLATVMPAALAHNQGRALRMAQRVVRIAMGSIAASPKLQDCTVASLRSSVIRACQLGLELDPTLMHASLVPFRGECTLIVGYRGYIQMAVRSGQVSSISAEVVWDGDDFDFQYGTKPFLRHKPKMDGGGETPLAVYATATMKDGAITFRVLHMNAVNKICEAAKKRGSGPWKDHWEEMARKTAVRNLAKYLPQCAEAQAEAVRGEAFDAGVKVPQVSWEQAEAEVVDRTDAIDADSEPTDPDEPGSRG